jgi:RHS repeat-associated protein
MYPATYDPARVQRSMTCCCSFVYEFQGREMSNKSGTSSQAVSLPQGGGAVAAIGETFSADLFTGTGNFSVPLELPEGRNGLSPQLSLLYSSGNGNGPFGMGWDLSLPGVRRKTSKGVPRYRDDAANPKKRDTFVLSGHEDLVAVAEPQPGVTRFRPRSESLFARIDRVRAAGEDLWRVGARDGTVSVYGGEQAVVADPSNPERVFAWRLAETTDPLGNRIEYGYRRDRAAWDQLYLEQIRYVDFEENGERRFLVTVDFVYEDRPDPYSEYRSGFEIRTRLRCTRIEVRTHANQDVLARSYELRYVDERVAAGELPADELPRNGASLLSLVRTIGHDGAATEELPPFEFGYAPYLPERQTFKALEADGAPMPSRSLADEEFETVSLFNNGLTDIVQLGTGARFWRNLGGGRYDAPQPLTELPANVQLRDPGTQLADMTGNGRADLLVLDSNGYFPMSFLGRWSATDFVSYEDAPSVTFEDAELRLVDLDGDGVTDALRTGIDFELFLNDPAKGWQPAELRPRGPLEEFPDLSFSDPRVKLADMTGDGLQDFVMVDQGRIDYWPYLGHGRWAARVTMSDSPLFADGSQQSFDPRRVLLGDLDGDGVDDVAYVEPRRLTVWINQGGRGWGEPLVIADTPPFTDTDAVRVADPLGSGFQGVLWTADEAGGASHYRFLELTGARKPYLLTRIDNHRGVITHIEHVSSTEFYLADLDDPQARWKTPLPFPVQVVKRVERIDEISGGKLTAEYRYRHGYWDGREREFRGFGLVDQLDSETFENFNTPGLHGDGVPFERVEARRFSPPTLTRTWFHLGDTGDEFQEREEADHSDEYWPGDPQMLPRPAATEALLAELTGEARAAALRCLRGSTLRAELYAPDGTSRADRPFTVTEHQYGLREEVRPDAGDARERIFFPHEAAQRATQWERGNEPKIELSFNEDHDAFGFPTGVLTVAVPRGRDPRRADGAAAQPYLSTYATTEYARRDDADGYIVDRVARATTYEVRNDGRSSVLELRDAVFGGDGGMLRVIGHLRTYYDGLAHIGLELGQLGRLGLPTRVESLAITDDFLDDLFDGSDPRAVSPRPPYLEAAPAWTDEYPEAFRAELPPLAGYRRYAAGEVPGSPGGYYITSTTHAYDPRGLPIATHDPMGAETRTEYDRFGLLVTAATDPAGLVTRASNDYRVLRSRELTDFNGNITAVTFSPAGFVTAQFVRGRNGEGDTRSPSVSMEYDLLAFSERRQPISVRTVRRVHHDTATDVPEPERGATITSVEYSDGFGRLLQTRIQAEDVRFGDPAFGGQTIPADPSEPVAATTGQARQPGEPDNVIVSGWQRYDNKGRVVESYEPFYATGWEFAAPGDDELGQRETQHYDARGLVVGTVSPDGSEERVVFGVPTDLANPESFDPTPWETYTYDANDNAGRTHPAAAEAYRDHWNTPGSIEIDALGRTVVTVIRNGPDPDRDWHITRSTYDIQGNLVSLTDPLGREALRCRFDVAQRRWRMDSVDAGRRDTAWDALGTAIEARDGKGAITLTTLDALQRPSGTWARDDTAGTVTLRRRIEYGDAADPGQLPAERDAARAHNLLGREVRSYDEAGLETVTEADFKGNVLDSSRRVIADGPILAVYEAAAASGWQVRPFQVDWQPRAGQSREERDAELLDPNDYRSTASFDALDRVTRIDLPRDVEGRRRRLSPRYNRAGALERVLLDDTVYVERIAYDANGHRALTAYGHGVMTRYAYDPRTAGLRRMRSEHYTRDGLTYEPRGDAIQDCTYEYDLARNLVRTEDRAPASGIPGNPDALGAADPALGALLASGDALERRFRYDPAYRLVSVTGRECAASTAGPGDPDLPRCTDLTRTHAYTESYEYDPCGGMRRLSHRNGSAGFTRDFTVDPGSNQVQRVEVGATAYDYTFDANGNVLSETASRHLRWNHADQMNAFATQTEGAEPSVHAQYLYDADGRRVKKLVRKQGGDFETIHYLDLFEHARWSSGSEENNHVHVMDDKQRIALVRVGPPHPADRGPADARNLADHLGSSGVVLDGEGGLVNREEYTPFGETSFGSYAKKRYRFTGKEADEESGLRYHGARYYQPFLARWVSCDPQLGGGGFSLYAYVRNCPMTLCDPTGEDDEETPTAGKGSKDTITLSDPYENPIPTSGPEAFFNSVMIGGKGPAASRRYEQMREDQSIIKGVIDKGWGCAACHLSTQVWNTYGPAGVGENGLPLDWTLNPQAIKEWHTRTVMARAGVEFFVTVGQARAGWSGSPPGPAPGGRPFKAKAIEATEAESWAPVRAEALGGQRIWLAGPAGGGESITRGLRISGNRVTYDTRAPGSAKQVKRDMGAIANHLGMRGQGSVRRGDWWTGTHGTPAGQFGTPSLLEHNFIKRERVFAPFYGWTARNVYNQPRSTVLNGALERPTAYSWCYSSSCFLPQPTAPAAGRGRP